MNEELRKALDSDENIESKAHHKVDSNEDANYKNSYPDEYDVSYDSDAEYNDSDYDESDYDGDYESSSNSTYSSPDNYEDDSVDFKIVCKKQDLLNALNIVFKAVPSKTSMSILECILIDSRDDIITFTANDMEIGIQTNAPGKIEVPGCVALDAKMLMSIVRSLPDNDITIVAKDTLKTTITCEKAVFNILAKEGSEFSFLPEYEKNNKITITQYSLKEGIRQTIFSVSDNDTNKLMSGELFEIKEDNLRIVSLDGHRISIRNIKMKNFYDPVKVVIPGKTLNEITKIISGDPEKDIDIYINANHIIFEFDETIVVSRLLDGEFFPIDQMLSHDYETKIKINKKSIQECVDRSTLLVNESDKKPLIIDINDDYMEFSINTPLGSMKENVNIKKTGKDIMIGFNPRFLLDVLKVLDDEEIDIYMLNPKAPCFIRDSGESYNYMILPVNFTTVY